MSGRNCTEEIGLSAFLDSELSEEAARGLEQHLAICRDCSASYESMKFNHDLLVKVLPDAEPPARIKTQLFDRLAESAARPSLGFWSWIGIGQVFPSRSRSWAYAGTSVFCLMLILSCIHLQRRINDGKILAQIDNSRAEWISRISEANPFNIDLNGAPLQVNQKNPFDAYLNEQ